MIRSTVPDLVLFLNGDPDCVEPKRVITKTIAAKTLV